MKAACMVTRVRDQSTKKECENQVQREGYLGERQCMNETFEGLGWSIVLCLLASVDSLLPALDHADLSPY
jgi:hypothetical protein